MAATKVVRFPARFIVPDGSPASWRNITSPPRPFLLCYWAAEDLAHPRASWQERKTRQHSHLSSACLQTDIC
ncbi:hypothetical protein A9K55_007875 [Cordyceps militaris]|uniref:Uncharacterized protein n=1 Tax=Cordyceps militaris TaxID=73501 RepID=A0A2H4SG67_CORMI|nr:hypothetical protein A9K55_007875 [Cordyceps militaris]